MAQQKTARTSKLARQHSGSPRSQAGGQDAEPRQSMRLDKWLWCARFFKTRSLAVEQIDKGRVMVNGVAAKPAREVHIDDVLCIGHGPQQRVVRILALSQQRGPAPQAQLLYEETAESVAARERQAQLRQLAPEPASGLRHGRPTKKSRRELDQLQQHWGRTPAALDARWSARLSDE